MSDVGIFIGQKFSELTVLKLIRRDKKGNLIVLCQCECGSPPVVVRAYNLKNGHTKSCGCLRAKSLDQTKHGNSRIGHITPEYRSWSSMINRCENEKSHAYANYGGRGIKVCKRWRDSFINFLNDMGKRPSKDHSLDRIDVNGNYEPSNCRWATSDIQARNTRRERNNTTGIAGISYCKEKNKYRVRISLSYKTIHIGYFETLIEAVRDRIAAENKYWGEAYTNVVIEGR